MSDPRNPGPPPLKPYPSFEERAYGTSAGNAHRPTLHAPARDHQPGPPRRKKRKRSKLWTVVFLLVFGGIAALSAAAMFLVVNPPTELIRAQLIDQIKSRTGRTLTIAGPTKFTLIPDLGLSMSDVTLSPPPGMSGPAFAKMAGLEVSVRLLPLLKREVSVDRLVLKEPDIDLRIDGSGRTSWDFAGIKGPEQPVQIAQAGNTASDAPGGLPDDAQEFLKNSSDARKQVGSQDLAALRQLQLGDVRIVNGTLRYSDARSGTHQQLSAVNVRFGLDNIRAPLEAKGNVKWRTHQVDFNGTLTSVDSILQNKPANLLLKLDSQPVSGRYDGTIHVADGVAAKGAVAINSPSLRQLAQWTGTSLPPAQGFGPMMVTGLLDSKGTTHRLSSAKIELDNQLAQGTVMARTGGARPYINADLKISQLDLNNYLGGGDGATKPQPARATSPAPSAAKPKQQPQSIEDLLNDNGTRVRGYAQRSGWSREPIDASALGSADVDAKLLVGALFVQNLKVGQSNLTVSLKNKALKTTIHEIALYDGRGTGTITATPGAGKAIGVSSQLDLKGVNARSLLKDAVNQDWLEGNGNVALTVSGTGQSQYQIVNSLGGNASIAFEDGAIVGINIPRLVRGISQGNFANLTQSTKSEKTDFSSLTSKWIIQSGVAKNDDLQLVSPLMRVTGAGSVMLGAQQLDYLLRPKLVASLEGQGGDDGTGLEIPIRLKGPWVDPQIQPQLDDILANPDKAIDAVKKLGQQFKGKNANEIIDGLLGGGNSGQENSGNTEKSNPAGDLLDRFLR